MERRLAAVLIGDVVGYSGLSQIDEEGTRARFQADLKEVFEPNIASYHGRLIKTMGDGVLVEFPSVVDALRCAVEVQQAKAKRNVAAPAVQRLQFRIGINLGDIIVEGEDIHGDGVNIADRIQTLAEPGGIAISGTVYDHVKTKLPVGYTSLGEQKLKSIAAPIRAYRVVMDPAAVGNTIGLRHKLRLWRGMASAAAVVLVVVAALAVAWWRLWPPGIEAGPTDGRASVAVDPSLVVLPFENLSDDREQGYLADGITEDLTTELARTPGLFVISRTAAFSYKGKEVPPTELAAELGIRYILKGSVRRIGEDLRINAQLIDASSSGHMWAQRFDGAWSEVFALQDKVIAEVSGALKLRLVTGPKEAAGVGGTNVPAAYDAYLKALEHLRLNTPKDFAQAASLYEQAVKLDPDFGRAWADYAWLYFTCWDVAECEAALGVAHKDMLPKVYILLEEAKKHPSTSYYRTLASVLKQARDSDAAISAIESAIALGS
jgi:Predicted integral membrane protein